LASDPLLIDPILRALDARSAKILFLVIFLAFPGGPTQPAGHRGSPGIGAFSARGCNFGSRWR